MDTDRNLLFGVLALQADIIDNDQFVKACTLWTAQKAMPLADILINQGWMTPPDRTDVERLLERKLKKHDGDAKASLMQMTEPSVREALATLEHPAFEESFIGPDQPSSLPDLSTVAYEPKRLGRYALMRQHALGGIGQVWLARDTDLGRDVALKEIRPDRGGNSQIWLRFLAEARITGQLEHPGIVPVYELVRGERDQRPFYTMRFIHGRTLSQACKQYHARRTAGEAQRMELHELLGAFVSVCQAIAYAHSRGVIHRDLKGSNVVLGDFGEVVVLDWGLAKMVDHPEDAGATPPITLPQEENREETQVGHVLGTPAYMSPEQAEGRLDRIDRRSDVYGLGAILYEILTGRPPFMGEHRSGLLHQVIHDTPLPPRSLVAGTPIALQAVCLKALAKKPGERYASASDLAQEVQRFLADAPVNAYKEPARTRLARWGRRHRMLMTSGAALLVAAVVALTAGTLLLGKANARTQEQRDLAQQNFHKARLAVDQYLTAVSENTLLKGPAPGLQPLRKELLELALAYYLDFLQQQGDNPTLQADLAAAYLRIGRINAEIGTKTEALTAVLHARELYETLTRAQPDNAALMNELANCHSEIGVLQSQTGEPAEGLRSLEQAVALGSTLIQDHPGVATYGYDLATNYRRLAHLQQLNGKSDHAVASLQHSIELLDGLALNSPNSLPYQVARAAVYNNLGLVRTFSGQTRAALEDDRRAVEIWEKLDRENPGNLEVQNGLAATSGNMGWLLSLRDRQSEALAAYERALSVREKMARENPKVGQYQTELARILTSLGSLYQTLDQPAKARQSHSQAVAIREKLVAGNPAVNLQIDLSWSYTQFAYLEIATGKPDDASRLYQQALGLATKLMATNSANPQLLYIISAGQGGMGRVYSKQGRPAEALQSLQEALTTLAKIPSGHLNVLYDRACWLALCSSVIGQGKTSLTPAEKAEREKFSEQAMGALREAVSAGQFSVHDLHNDRDLDGLRSREDFKKLLREAEAMTQERTR
jgi:tetratricopeptide (TPR) repeat protein